MKLRQFFLVLGVLLSLWSFATEVGANTPPALSWQSPLHTASPGEPVQLYLQAEEPGNTPPQVEIYPLQLAEAFTKGADLNYLSPSATPWESWREYVEDPLSTAQVGAYVEFSGRQGGGYPYQLPLLKVGAYLLRAQQGAGQALGLVIISPYRALAFDGGSKPGVVWFSDLQGRSWKPQRVWQVARPGAPEEKIQTQRLEVGASGLLSLPARSAGREAAILAYEREELALCLLPAASPYSSHWKAFLWSEERMVTPGQPLAFQGLVVNLKSNRAPGLRQVFKVQLVDLQGQVAAQSEVSALASGWFQGELELSPDLERQPYTLRLCDPQGVLVEEAPLASSLASPSPWKLQVKPAAPLYKRGQTVKLNLELLNSEGLPQAGTELNLSFSLAQAQMLDAYRQGNLGLEATNGFAPVAALPTMKALTNPLGEAQIQFPCPNLATGERWGIVRVQAVGQDPQGRAVRASCTWAVAANDNYLEARGPELLEPGQKGYYWVQLSDALGRTATKAQVELTVIDSQGASQSLEKRSINSLGQTVFTWEPARSGRYTLKFAAQNGEGWRWQRSQVVQVAERDPERLTLRVSRPWARVGERFSCTLQAPSQCQQALLILEEGGYLRRFLLPLSAGQATLSWTVTHDLGPNLRLWAGAWQGGELLSAQEEVGIFDPSQRLQVGVKWKNSPVSGHLAHLQVTTRNAQGQPVPALVNLRLVGPQAQPFLWADNLLAPRLSTPPFQTLALVVDGQSQEAEREPAVVLFPENRSLAAGQIHTDSQGVGQFEVAMPKEEGEWLFLAEALSEGGELGQYLAPLKLHSDIALQLEGPKVLNSGDVARLTVKLYNRQQKPLAWRLQASVSDVERLAFCSEGGEVIAELERGQEALAGRSGEELPFLLKGGLPGVADLILELESMGKVERYTFPLEVAPMAAVYRQDKTLPFTREVSLQLDNFRPEYVGRVVDRQVQVQILHGWGGLVCATVEALRQMGADCAPGIMARWAAPVVAAPPFVKYDLATPSYFQVEPAESKTSLGALQAAQNQDGGFSWRLGLESDPLVSVWLTRYLWRLHAAGAEGLETTARHAQLYLERQKSKLSLEGRLLSTLAEGEIRLSAGDMKLARQRIGQLRNPAYLAFLNYLCQRGELAEAQRLWQKAKGRFQWSSGRSDLEKVCAFWPGQGLMSDIQTTALAALVSYQVESNSTLNRAFLQWLAEERRGGAWSTELDSLVALEAVTAGMYVEFKDPGSASYALWLNGNEVESDRGLDASSGWQRTLKLRVAQLPDAPLDLKVIKSGEAQAWVHADETLVLRSLPAEGWRVLEKRRGHLAVTSPAFSLRTRYLGPKPASSLSLRAGSGLDLELEIEVKRPLRYVRLALPRWAGWSLERIVGLEKAGGYWEKSSGHLYFNSLAPGRWRLILEGQALYPGRYALAPAQMELWEEPGAVYWGQSIPLEIREAPSAGGLSPSQSKSGKGS